MSKTQDIELTKIVVRMGDTEQSLTLEQAKKLHAQLSELFAAPHETHIHHHDYWWRRSGTLSPLPTWPPQFVSDAKVRLSNTSDLSLKADGSGNAVATLSV